MWAKIVRSDSTKKSIDVDLIQKGTILDLQRDKNIGKGSLSVKFYPNLKLRVLVSWPTNTRRWSDALNNELESFNIY